MLTSVPSPANIELKMNGTLDTNRFDEVSRAFSTDSNIIRMNEESILKTVSIEKDIIDIVVSPGPETTLNPKYIITLSLPYRKEKIYPRPILFGIGVSSLLAVMGLFTSPVIAFAGFGLVLTGLTALWEINKKVK
ncbi:hypothetical protein JdFRA1000001_23 [uncultured archaeal virus]|uniref:Uncharacterized protein n=1 Tax=uncultured archaeal virus TaxID=1960247 RepID=A0A1S5Y2X1_9VIRU|nr:hypothetical protein JdFRA1000001_23 [uncultured archaeal virus]